MLALSLSTLMLAAGAMADFVPTAPAPGDAFAADSDCAIQWEADATGKWTNVSICEPTRIPCDRALTIDQIFMQPS